MTVSSYVLKFETGLPTIMLDTKYLIINPVNKVIDQSNTQKLLKTVVDSQYEIR